MANETHYWSNHVTYFPYENRDNNYNDINKELIRSLGFEVNDLYRLPLRKLMSRRWVIANWLESHCAASNSHIKWKNTAKIFALLLSVVISRSRFIYVRHNHIPHGLTGNARRLARLIIWLQEKIAYLKLCHLPGSHYLDYCFIPHPLYQRTPFSEADFSEKCRFAIVGAVTPYKKIDELLAHWPQELPLTIAGQCSTKNYLDELKQVIAHRHLNADITNRRLSDEELVSIVTGTEVIVIAHDDDSAIVSGTYYLAKTGGCITLSRRAHGPAQCLGDYVANAPDQLGEIARNIANSCNAAHSRTEVFRDAERYYGHSTVRDYWKNYLCSKPRAVE